MRDRDRPPINASIRIGAARFVARTTGCLIRLGADSLAPAWDAYDYALFACAAEVDERAARQLFDEFLAEGWQIAGLVGIGSEKGTRDQSAQTVSYEIDLLIHELREARKCTA